jgi:tripartite motif-containing protein 71
MGYQSTMRSKRLAALVLFASLPLLALASPAGANLEFERQWSVGAQPTSLDLDGAGNTYVSIVGDQILAFDVTGEEATRWGSSSTNPPGDGQFNLIGGIAIDRADGLLYATDQSNHRIQKFLLNGVFIQKWGTQGIASGHVKVPAGIATAPDGSVYVAEVGNNRVQHFGDAGTALETWGSQGYDDATQFDQPRAIAVGPDGHVFVGDRAGRIREFDAFGNFIKRFGEQDPTDADGLDDGGFGPNQGVYALAVDSAGLIYAVDRDYDRIQVFRPDGTFLSKLGSTGSAAGRFDEPVDVAVGPDNRLYVAERGNNRVQVFSTTGLRPGGGFGFAGAVVNRKKGFTVLRVRVPRAGRVQLLASPRNRPATVRARGKSTVRLKVVAKGRSLRLLRQRKRLTIQVSVRFTPAGGTPRTKKTRVMLALR